MKIGQGSNKDFNFLQDFRKKYSEIKQSSKPTTKGSISSIDRIAEFRKKLEGSFISRPDFHSREYAEESYSSTPKYSFDLQQNSRPLANGKLSKQQSITSVASLHKQKLEDTLPLNSIIEVRKLINAANQESIEDLPYLYAFTLTKFCRLFDEKFPNQAE